LLEPGIGARQEFTRQQAGQEGLVGCGVQHRQQAEHHHQRGEHGNVQVAGGGEQGHSGQHDRSAEVRADQQRFAADAVGQHACEQSNREVGDHARASDDSDVGGGTPEVGDDEHTDREDADVGATVGDRGGSPEPAEPGMASQRRSLVRHQDQPAMRRA